MKDEINHHAIRTKIPINFTGKKAALIEIGYALASSGDINHGNIEIKEFMNYLSFVFNIDLGGYYDAYIAMKERKDRTSCLRILKFRQLFQANAPLPSSNLPIIRSIRYIGNLVSGLSMFYFVKRLSVFRIVAKPFAD